MSGDAYYFLSRLNEVRRFLAANAVPFEPYPRKAIVEHFRSQGWGRGCARPVHHYLVRLQEYGRVKYSGGYTVLVDSERIHWPVTMKNIGG